MSEITRRAVLRGAAGFAGVAALGGLASCSRSTGSVLGPGSDAVATAEAAIKVAVDNACACVIAIGGGTPVDTGKCVAAVLTNGGSHPDLYDFLEVVGRARALTKRCAPFIAVPTTAGPGAEVTKNSVLEAGDRKVSMRHPFMLPSVVVIDPELTLSMPKEVTAHTGLGTYALHT